METQPHTHSVRGDPECPSLSQCLLASLTSTLGEPGPAQPDLGSAGLESCIKSQEEGLGPVVQSEFPYGPKCTSVVSPRDRPCRGCLGESLAPQQGSGLQSLAGSPNCPHPLLSLPIPQGSCTALVSSPCPADTYCLQSPPFSPPPPDSSSPERKEKHQHLWNI